MSAAELKKLKASGGQWCFIDGVRVRRTARIKELEAKAKAKAKKGGKNEEPKGTPSGPSPA